VKNLNITLIVHVYERVLADEPSGAHQENGYCDRSLLTIDNLPFLLVAVLEENQGSQEVWAIRIAVLYEFPKVLKKLTDLTVFGRHPAVVALPIWNTQLRMPA
jgi:hypothetical protein